MQSAKSAAASVKETAVNVAASAKAGVDKAKATMQEKVEKMGAHDPIQKDMATQKKEEKIHVAEQNKQEARNHNATARHLAADTSSNRHITASSGFTTPDYLTGSDISGPIPAHDTNVEFPSTGTGHNLAHNISQIRPNSPNRGLSNVDAVYPDDIGLGPNQADSAQGGSPTSGFGTGGLLN